MNVDKRQDSWKYPVPGPFLQPSLKSTRAPVFSFMRLCTIFLVYSPFCFI